MPPPLPLRLRVAVVQLRPLLGQVPANIARARRLCAALRPRDVDIVCFPEMAFTGYAFDTPAALQPLCEPPHAGPTARFCAELAAQLQCYVAAGYAERLDPAEPPTLAPHSPSFPTGTAVGANSVVLYSPAGEPVLDYRKTNLFETDLPWAKPGTGFKTVHLPFPPVDPTTVVPLAIGICMDLNPHPPQDGSNPTEYKYELAEHCLTTGARVLLLLNAWLDSEANKSSIDDEFPDRDAVATASGLDAEEEEEQEEDDPNDHDWNTLRYWSARLAPLWRQSRSRQRADSTGSAASTTTIVSSGSLEGSEEEIIVDGYHEDPHHETVVIVCNRTGRENGMTFAGTSAIFTMRTGSGRPKLLDMMSRREEGIRIWSLAI